MRVHVVVGPTALCCAAVMAMAACDAPTFELGVNLRSDFTPGTEVTHAQTEILGRPPAVEVVLERTDRLFEGVRIADFRGLPAGPVTVRVTLLRADGTVAARTDVRVTIEEDLLVTIVLGRACLGVVCPGPTDDPGATACENGICVVPACTGTGCDPGPGPGPEPSCVSDSDCASGVECAPGRCVERSCLLQPDDSLCGFMEICRTDVGCAGCEPAPEVCNAADDDCDFRIDEDFDFERDETNCGGCGVVCPGGEPCENGHCPCTGSDADCPAGHFCCTGFGGGGGGIAGGCFAESETNCGGCGVSCGPTSDRCTAGACACGSGAACAAGLRCCGGACVDVTSDPLHCGVCARACAGGPCTAGVCTCSVDADCASGELCCGAACRRVQVDEANCGACGTVCSGATDSCRAGVCTCAGGPACGAGLACCLGDCTDLGSDRSHCGACRANCRLTESCIDSTCTPA